MVYWKNKQEGEMFKTETDVGLRQVGGGYEGKLVLMLNSGSGATGEALAAAGEAQQQVNE